MNDFHDLKVWQESMDLVVKVYETVEVFPKTEIYGLTNQIKRSAVSIPSNIAEGAGRNGQKEFNQFLGISSGSASELSTQIEIAQRLKYIDKEATDAIQKQLDYIQKMIYKLQKSIQKTI